MAALNILWHLHQPDYRRPGGGQALLPWVRLHAVKGYSDLAHALEHAPEARCTVNFSGILLAQLQHLAGGSLDYYAELSLRPPAELEPVEREFMLRNFFSAHAASMINVHPRYRELLRRSQALVRRQSLEAAALELTDQELRDLAVWFNLAWIGFANSRRPEISRLIARGRNFDGDDMQLVLDTHLEIARGVLAHYRELARADIIELSITPQHHPILPLLLDLPRMATPDAANPLPEFTCTDCAAWHVRQGIESYRQAFDTAPAGAWPAEGSVSDAALGLIAEHGIGWAATDQQNLPPGHGSLGHLQPYRWADGGRELVLFFRDTRLADNIGFEYARWNAETAARHFVQMVGELSRHSGLDQPVVTVALDGENPWENYHDGGSRFLNSLFAEIAASHDLECRLPRELAQAPGLPAISHVSPGSWIGGNFDVWSRHPETRRAWTVLAAAHAALGHQGNAEVDAELHAAEGSDYFWWYGDDFSSNEKPMFDELFREHLQQAYRLAGQEIPAELLVPIGIGADAAAVPVLPTIRTPVIDGRLTTFYEWHGARIELGIDAGAMARQAAGGIRDVWMGVVGGELYLRIDLDQPLLEQAAAGGVEFDLAFSRNGVERNIEYNLPPDTLPFHGHGFAVDRLVELVVSFGEAGLVSGKAAALQLEVRPADGIVHRFPAGGPFRFSVPERSAALTDWMV